MKILIINVAGIGDFFELIRWLYLVKKQKPYFIVDILVSDRIYDYAKDCPYVRKVYSFKTCKQNVSLSFLNLFTLLKIKREKYDVILNTFPTCSLFGDVKFLIMLFFLKNKNMITFGPLWKERLNIYDRNIVLDKIEYKSIFESFGIFNEDIYKNIIWKKNDEISYKFYFLKNFIFFNPFTNFFKKDIPEKLILFIIEKFAKLNYNLVFFSNSFKKVFDIYNFIDENLKKRCFIFTKGNTYEFIYLIEKSEFVITADTSSLHIASVLNKKVYCIFPDFSYRMHEPYNIKNVKYINFGNTIEYFNNNFEIFEK
ncbi:MAG: hypothetical protein N2114_04705 [Candidatus Goldbacteria bacterium]|nr:hypothetical protein [Candidatus Goldiibacteriota bacterium]